MTAQCAAEFSYEAVADESVRGLHDLSLSPEGQENQR